MGLASRCGRAAAARGGSGPRRTAPSSHLLRRRHTTAELLESVTRDRRSPHPSSSFLRCFPLRADDVLESPHGPGAFHRLLCQRVRDASKRVQLASLYVGAAAAKSSSASLDRRPHDEERELLESIARAAGAGVPIQILLDANRALRPVPLPSSARPSSGAGAPAGGRTATATTTPSTTTSARACRDALTARSGTPPAPSEGGEEGSSSGVFLLSALPPVLQRMLPNPLNEIAGVFHVKVYVVDDDVILSGANLSHEYFTTRIDRYLHLRQPDLVEFYSQLVRALCEHGAVKYDPTGDDQHAGDWAVSTAKRRQLQTSLKDLFTTMDPPFISSDHGDVVAYAVPTFQAPTRYFSRPTFMDHEQALHNLLQSVHEAGGSGTVTARIATAYMNPTTAFLRALAAWCDRTVFLTAGLASHGFAPKGQPASTDRPEDQSQGWAIPNVFRYASRRAVRYIHLHRRRQRLRRNEHQEGLPQPTAAQTAYYQRPGWTFHAKGLWLSVEDATRDTPPQEPPSTITFSPRERLVAVCTGSGNYGARSARRDMESNLLLIFPPPPAPPLPSSSATTGPVEPVHVTPTARQHTDEWNRLCEFSREDEGQGVPDLPRWIRFAYPWVRPFF